MRHKSNNIDLLNVSFKCFTKVATNRITNIAHKIISPIETAFILGRNIMEGTVIFTWNVTWAAHQKNKIVLSLRLILKRRDKVKWDFLQQTLRMKGFSGKWCSWIENFIKGGNVIIKVNDQLGSYIQTKKDLWQGDPPSPLLFNIVVDKLAVDDNFTLLLHNQNHSEFSYK